MTTFVWRDETASVAVRGESIAVGRGGQGIMLAKEGFVRELEKIGTKQARNGERMGVGGKPEIGNKSAETGTHMLAQKDGKKARDRLEKGRRRFPTKSEATYDAVQKGGGSEKGQNDRAQIARFSAK